MLSTPVSVQRQLTEALAIISKHDFPQNWPSLLPELVARTADADFRVVNGVLQVANSIFKRYRTEFKSERLWQEIALVLQHFSAPLLTLFQRTLAAVMAPQNANDATALSTLFETVRLVCRIYLSLCSQDHPDFFASKVNEFWSTFLELLKYDNPLLASRDDDTPGVLERVKSAICEIACMFAEKYEEDFRSFVPPFVSQTWNMLTVIGDKGKYDEVCVKAIKFLTVVVSQQWHQELFGADHVLQTMCEKVVIPNIRLRETDIELFEMNGVEYVRRDIEGSDSDTRRRTTVDFVKGLCVCFEERITKILQGYTNVLLNNYAANPTKNWIDKDAAMYITLALTVQGSVQSTGVVKLNQYVDFGSFFTAHVMPELQRTDVNALPVLKADALKFVSVFRAQLPREALVTLMPLVVAHLRSTEFVVHTYAAHAIDRVLTVKEPGTNTLRLNRESMLPAIEPALGGLFAALQHPDSVENEYLMRAIMRVVATAKADIVPVLEPALRGAIGVLATVAQHPRNPAFNHALFETIASLVKNTCESQLGPTTTVSVTGVPSATPACVAQFEQFLFPHFQTVLGMENCDEFAPYVFQLLAQLLEFRSDVSPAYQGIFPALLVPATWENHGSIPALVRLIEAYIVRDVAFIVRSNYTELVLGVFQKLIAAKQHDHHGLQLMSTLFEFLPMYATTLFVLLCCVVWSVDLVCHLFPQCERAAVPATGADSLLSTSAGRVDTQIHRQFCACPGTPGALAHGAGRHQCDGLGADRHLLHGAGEDLVAQRLSRLGLRRAQGVHGWHC
jgi:exportin-2 (importin alpha re-exporter)